MIANAKREPTVIGGEVTLGARVRFIPAANFDNSAGFGGILMEPVTGTISYINEARRWYQVEYIMGHDPGCIGYECFKF